MANPLPRDIAPAFAQPVAPDHVRARLREILGLDVLPGAVDFAVEDAADEGDFPRSVSVDAAWLNGRAGT